MIGNNYSDEKEIEAIKLIDQAETLVDHGKGKEALEYYEKAASIYLDLGSYIKLDELYIRIANIISQFQNNIQAVYRLKSIIRKTEELKLNEVSAKLLIQLGNLSFRMRDWENAGESWEKAANYLYEADPEEYNSLSSILLLKAGQSFERSSIKREIGKRLIFKAVMKINKFDEVYEEEEKRAFDLLSKEEFEAAAEKFLEIADHFRTSLNTLGDFIDEEESKDTMLNAKARFIHFVAEYQTVAALCLRASEDRSFNEQIKNLGQDSLQLFQESISLLKSYLIPITKSRDFDNEIILRITFDTMLMAITQGMLGVQQLDTIDFLLVNTEINKVLIKKLKKSPYFKIAERMEKLGIREAFEELSKIHLGHFESIKNKLITYYS
jgi:tetratricopeptide (TPR) repeat protein